MNEEPKKKGVVMLAGMTTPAIVPICPIRQLSGRIIPKKVAPDWCGPDCFPRHYPFFLASLDQLLPADPYDFLPMEDDNV
jgi:hypothetical protein